MEFKLILSPTVIKKIKKIGTKDLKKVESKFDQLKTNPFLGQPLQGQLKGLYKLKVWPLRIIYEVDVKNHQIRIVTIGYRGDIYKNLKA